MMFIIFTHVFRSVTDKHAHLKTKIITRNQALFMTKALSKAIMTRSRSTSKYKKFSSRGNFLAFRKAKSFCNNFNKKTNKAYFEQMTRRGSINSKSFWNTLKPFLIN